MIAERRAALVEFSECLSPISERMAALVEFIEW